MSSQIYNILLSKSVYALKVNKKYLHVKILRNNLIFFDKDFSLDY